MDSPSLLDRVSALADPTQRSGRSLALAKHLGAEALLMFVKDAELDVFVPAPGFPSTVPGGPTWRELLTACATSGRYRGVVAYPTLDEHRPVSAITLESGTAFFLIGGEVRPEKLNEMQALLPLLGSLLRVEQAAVAAGGHVAIARASATHAQTLATALERSRGEVEKMLAESARLNSELQAADARKDEFLAMLAHELRNPLAPMVAALHLLQHRGGNGRELEILNRQLSQLTHLVDDLLDVARITRGLIELRRETVDVGRLLSEAIEITQPSLEARRHQLEVLLSDVPLFVSVDPMRAVQVFSNLLSNAVKYTDPRGRISIEAKEIGGQVVVEVEDSGIGISAEVLPKVFDLFVQAPRSLDRTQGGLGIGLRLVKALVELHGGRVSAASAGLGKGSQFQVQLPLCAAKAAPLEASEPAPAPKGPERSLNILLVEDNADAAESMAEILELSGHRVKIASDGLIALTIAAALQPEVVLLDLGLPGLNGYQVAERLRVTHPDTHLIALTGYNRDADRKAAKDAGFNEYLVKPVDIDVLIDRLSKVPATSLRLIGLDPVESAS